MDAAIRILKSRGNTKSKDMVKPKKQNVFTRIEAEK